MEIAGILKPFLQILLHKIPRFPVDGKDSEQIGDQPFRSGNDFGKQIGIACRHHGSRCGFQNIRVRKNRIRRRTRHCLFQSVHGKRGSFRGIAVDGSRGRNAEVFHPGDSGGAFDKVVDDAGTNSNRDGVFCDHFRQFLTDALQRVRLRNRRKDFRFRRPDPGILQYRGDLFPCRRPGVPVGDQPGCFAGEIFFQNFRSVFQSPRFHDKNGSLHSLRNINFVH